MIEAVHAPRGRWAVSLATMALLLACAGGGEAGDNGGSFGPGGGPGSGMGSDTGDVLTGGGPGGMSQSGSGNSQSGPSSQTSPTDSNSGVDPTGTTGSGDTETDPACEDGDGDGFGVNCQSGDDCDDDDDEINPGVPEVCDSVDHNCDGDPEAGCECPDDGVGGDCNTPFDLGTLAVDESQLGVVGNVPTEGGVDWYRVSFPATVRPGDGMPALRFAINEGDAFVFDVVTDQCGTAGVACTSGGGPAGTGIGLTDWTFIDDDPMCCAPPMDALVAWPQTVFVRVYRTSPGASCAAYQLETSR